MDKLFESQRHEFPEAPKAPSGSGFRSNEPPRVTQYRSGMPAAPAKAGTHPEDPGADEAVFEDELIGLP